MSENDGCEMCQIWRERGASYCGSCGRALRTVPAGNAKGGFIHSLAKACAVLVLIGAVCAVVFLVANYGNIVNVLRGIGLSVYIPLGLADIRLFWLSGPALEAYFVLELAAIVFFIAYAVRRTLAAKRESGGDGERVYRSDFVAASSLTAVLLGASMAYIMAMALIGYVPDSSWLEEYDEWLIAFMLANAGFQEEIAYRVILIGLPLAVIAMVRYRGVRNWRLLLGGFGMSKATLVLIVVSSVIFGLAHYDGWGWVKIINAFIAGILFAYAYTEYGLHVCVIMHFMNDTLTLFAGGILIELALMGLGIVVLIYWIVKADRSKLNVAGLPGFPGQAEGKVSDVWKRH